MARPRVIGLTGGIGAGKSEALAAFGRLGVATLSSDAVVHELLDTPEVRERLIGRWGPEIAPDGAIDRGRVSGIVFQRPEELSWLEGVLHPLVGKRMKLWLGTLPPETDLAVVEVPLLFETAMEGAFDVTVAVVAAEDVRRRRAASRGHDLVEERVARQLGQEEKAARADHVVRNDGSLRELEARLAEVAEELRGRAGERRPDRLQS